jgi:hypothetical protein
MIVDIYLVVNEVDVHDVARGSIWALAHVEGRVVDDE